VPIPRRPFSATSRRAWAATRALLAEYERVTERLGERLSPDE